MTASRRSPRRPGTPAFLRSVRGGRGALDPAAGRELGAREILRAVQARRDAYGLRVTEPTLASDAEHRRCWDAFRELSRLAGRLRAVLEVHELAGDTDHPTIQLEAYVDALNRWPA